ncbi:MAG: nicotinate-nucleotide adenylyltransferase [Desulfovibrio sp.]|nr:MAG: nicotinate-nucleotide adenylyltransferase [Desulfovibrio sp.]
MERKYPMGVIHGRFQVPHLDHMRYLLAGKARCEHLVVGVTNPDPLLTHAEATDPERGKPASNPLTFFERQALLRAALREADVPWQEFSIVPLPIGRPELYGHYVPLDAVFFLTIYDAWGRAKKERFEAQGLSVEVLWERPPEAKGISGCQLREAMARGGDWHSLTTPAVADMLEEWGIPERVRNMGDEDGQGGWVSSG